MNSDPIEAPHISHPRLRIQTSSPLPVINYIITIITINDIDNPTDGMIQQYVFADPSIVATPGNHDNWNPSKQVSPSIGDRLSRE